MSKNFSYIDDMIPVKGNMELYITEINKMIEETSYSFLNIDEMEEISSSNSFNEINTLIDNLLLSICKGYDFKNDYKSLSMSMNRLDYNDRENITIFFIFKYQYAYNIYNVKKYEISRNQLIFEVMFLFLLILAVYLDIISIISCTIVFLLIIVLNKVYKYYRLKEMKTFLNFEDMRIKILLSSTSDVFIKQVIRTLQSKVKSKSNS